MDFRNICLKPIISHHNSTKPISTKLIRTDLSISGVQLTAQCVTDRVKYHISRMLCHIHVCISFRFLEIEHMIQNISWIMFSKSFNFMLQKEVRVSCTKMVYLDRKIASPVFCLIYLAMFPQDL